MTGKTKIITSHLSSDHEEVLVRGLHIHHVWKRQNDTIIDVIGTDKDAKYYIFCPLENILDTQYKENNK